MHFVTYGASAKPQCLTNNPYQLYSILLHVGQQTQCGRSLLTAQLSQCELKVVDTIIVKAVLTLFTTNLCVFLPTILLFEIFKQQYEPENSQIAFWKYSLHMKEFCDEEKNQFSTTNIELLFTAQNRQT